MRITKFWTIGLCLLTLGTTGLAAQEEAAPAMPEMSEEQAAQMEAWMKAMMPGEQHAMLAEGVGEWKMTVTSWADPSSPEPMVSVGTASREMMMDGRILHETVDSEVMGMPFHGEAMTGYDNNSGEYWSTWVDNMSTGVMVMTGSMNEDGTAEFSGTTTSPFGPMKMRIEMETEDGKEVHTFYETMPEAEERKSMEIVYERAGA